MLKMVMSLKMLWCLILVELSLVAAAMQNSTLKQGELMNSSTTLVSSNHLFALGFFRLKKDQYSDEESEFSYLGIWYINSTNSGGLNISHPAWIANRDRPIRNNSGVLSLEVESGRLIISHNNASNPIVFYSGQGLNRKLTLLDDGNLVLEEGGETLWQSFDHPTDALLPGMKLGISHRSNRSWSLTSWLDEYDPTSGAFTLEWDHSARILVVKFRGKPYWTSGKLINDKFENINNPLDVVKLDYRFKNVTNRDEEYFFYTLVDNHSTPENQNFGSGWQLTYQGNIYDGERFAIAKVDECYGYNTRGTNYTGCELWEQPKCRNHQQIFEIQTGYFEKTEDYTVYDDHNASHGYSDCKAECWEDCSCFGFEHYGGTEGCNLHRGRNLKFQPGGAYGSKYVLRDADPSGSDIKVHSREKKKGIFIMAIVVVASSILVLLSTLLYCRRKKIRQAKKAAIQDLLTLNGYMETVDELGNNGRSELKFFSFTSIVAATGNFSPINKLGEGGFGPVYKGKFLDGKEIAVKRLSRKSTQGLTELKNELILIAKLQHTNLVRLLGCCIHRQEKMLIYEYMPNKSLDSFLFNERKREQLTWERRLSIIEGIAQGLLYLHKYSRLRIIHRDLKAANILLDQHMNPKISDFGLARIFTLNSSETYTSRVVGTHGYMAPEYVIEGTFSTKSDVYSFGVLVLEILSGRKINSFNQVEGPSNLVAFAWELWNRDAAFELMDPSISDSCLQNQFLRCVHIGLLCVEDDALDRPTMDNVTSMLANDTAVLPNPRRPAFYIESRAHETKSQETKSSQNISVNGLSASLMEAR
ncbi:hypothetical protein ACET3Z_004019 [Daucus carota]